MRTRLIPRVLLGAAATALAVGTLGAGTASAMASHPAQIKAQHTAAKKDGKGKKHKHCKCVHDNREYETEISTKIGKAVARGNHFGGGNLVGQFYHGGTYVIGAD